MAQTGYTPIQLYYSTTASAVPTAGNLASGELAINITDGKLYYKNNSGVVTLLAGATAGPAGGSNTQVQFNSSGVLAGSANMTFNGTTLTVNDLTDSSLTAGRVTFAGTAGNLTDSANLTWNGSTLAVTGAFSATTTIAAGGAIKSTGANLINEASAIKISQEGVALSSVTAYGNDASTQGTLRIRMASSDGSASAIPALFSSTGLAVTGTLSATSTITASSGASGSSIALVTIGTANNTVGGSGNQLLFNYGSNASSRSWKLVNDFSAFGDLCIAQSTTQTGSTYTSIANFNSTGLGIGTAPAYKLDVRTTGTGNVANFQSDSGPNIRFTGTETSGRTYQIGEGLVNAGNFSIYDASGSAERLVINGSGSVGINVAAPNARFQVNALNGSPLLYVDGTTYSYDPSSGITLTTSNTSAQTGINTIMLANNTYSVGAYSPILSFTSRTASGAYNNVYAGVYGVMTGQGVDNNWVTGDLVLATGGGAGITERMRILGGISTGTVGYVGMGISAPNSKLEVSLNGTSATSTMSLSNYQGGADGYGSKLAFRGQRGAPNAQLEYGYIQATMSDWAGAPYMLMGIMGGYVGINTNTPESRFAVKGGSGASNLFSISDIAVPTSGAEFGVGMIKSSSTNYLLNITGYNANSKGLRIYATGGTQSDYAFYITSGYGDRLILDGTGNLLVGTNSTSGSLTNYNPVYAGSFKTAQGSVSTTSGVAATLFTAPAGFGSYFITVWINADDCVNYQLVAVLSTQPNGSAKINTIVIANLLTVSLSGYNVQATQSSGGGATVNYTATRIAA